MPHVGDASHVLSLLWILSRLLLTLAWQFQDKELGRMKIHLSSTSQLYKRIPVFPELPLARPTPSQG